MKRLVFALTTVFVLLIFVSCNNNSGGEENDRKDGFSNSPKNREDSLFHDVMNGHDIAMPRMDRVSNYLIQIQKALDSMNKLPEKKLDREYQQSLIDLQEDLNYAQFGMDTWMNEFRIDSAKDDKEKRIQYLEGEKEKITKVKDAVLGGLKRADSLFIRKN